MDFERYKTAYATMTRDDASETAERIRVRAEVLTNLEHWLNKPAQRYFNILDYCKNTSYPYITSATTRLEHGVYALSSSRDKWRATAIVALAVVVLAIAFGPVW